MVDAQRAASARAPRGGTNRIAHVRGCADCEPTWERYDAALASIPAGAMVSAVGEIETNVGPKRLLVDAEDLEGLDEEGADV